MKYLAFKFFLISLIIFIVCFGSQSLSAKTSKMETQYKSFDFQKLSKPDQQFFNGLKSNSLLGFYYLELHQRIKKAVVNFPFDSKITLYPHTIYQIPQEANRLSNISYERKFSAIEQIETSIEKVYAKGLKAQMQFEADKLYQLRIEEKGNKALPLFKQWDVFTFGSFPLVLEDGKKIMAQSLELRSQGRWPLTKDVKNCTKVATMRPLFTRGFDPNWAVCLDKAPYPSKGNIRFAKWEWIVKNILDPDKRKKLIQGSSKKKNNNSLMLHTLAYNGDLNGVKKQLKNGALINRRDNKGMSPLFLATISKNIEMVQFLLDNGADPNLRDNYGSSSLMFSSYAVDIKMGQLLIDNGAKVYLTNIKDEIAETIALREGHESFAVMLKKNEAKNVYVHLYDLVKTAKQFPNLIDNTSMDAKIDAKILKAKNEVDKIVPNQISENELSELIDMNLALHYETIMAKPMVSFIEIFFQLCKKLEKIEQAYSGSGMNRINEIKGFGGLPMVELADTTNIKKYKKKESRIKGWQLIEADFDIDPAGYGTKRFVKILNKRRNRETNNEVLEFSKPIFAKIKAYVANKK